MNHQVHVLPNGATIVLEHRPDAVDFAYGVAYRIGSRDESLAEQGFSHAFEHMVSRGSVKYPSTYALVRPLDRLDGEANAFTDWEWTAFHVCVPAHGWETAVDLTSDMLLNPLFRTADLKLEIGAILEEWGIYEDDPEEKLDYVMQRLLYGDSTLGRNIIGEKKNIRGFTPEGLRAFHERMHGPANTVIVAVGMLPDGLLAELDKRFGGIPASTAGHLYDELLPVAVRHQAVHRPDMEQVRYSLGFRTPYGYGDRHLAAAAILATAFASYTSSILFQEVRDKRGLAYDIAAAMDTFRGAGDFVIQGGSGLKKFERALKIIVREMRAVKKRGLLPVDLADAISCVTSRIIMGGRDSEDRMQQLMEAYTMGDSCADQNARRAAYLAVTNDDIIAVANEMWRASEARLATVGPVADLAPYLPIIARLGG